MGEAKTRCDSCDTHWGDVDVLADGKCATCLLNERDSESRWATEYLRERDEARAVLDRLTRELEPTIERWEGQMRLSKRLLDERDAARAENRKLKEENRSLRFQLRDVDIEEGGDDE